MAFHCDIYGKHTQTTCIHQVANTLATSNGFRESASNSLIRTDSRFAPSQRDSTLLCNEISHWLDASLESALIHIKWDVIIHPYHNPTVVCQNAVEVKHGWVFFMSIILNKLCHSHNAALAIAVVDVTCPINVAVEKDFKSWFPMVK